MDSSRVVVITGANNGIGLGLAKALHLAGERVACIDLSGEHLSGLFFLPCDVTDISQVNSSVASIIDRWGRVDILVNNACLAVFSSFEEKKIEDTRREIEVNYFGYIHMIQAILPTMKTQGGGVIHNVSSTVGITGFAGIYGYASTKGSIEALSRTLAIELRPHGIIVNLVHPPLTRTHSSAPLGVPAHFMADPDKVGKKLAKKIGSKKAIITPGMTESFGVLISRLIPELLGRFLSSKAATVRKG